MNNISGYKTKQRSLILDILIENKSDHITAETLLEILKGRGETVGKSTIYRYLDKLVAEGKVRKFVIGEGNSACYQYTSSDECSKHYHLKCTACGKLIHTECGFLNDVYAHVETEHNFKVDTSKTVFYGLCENCLKKD